MLDQSKEIQDISKRSQDPLKDVHNKLAQLILDILKDSTLFQNKEFESLWTRIQEDKIIKANQICSLLHVKFVGENNEPKKLFFDLLKDKQQRESMHSFLIDNNVCIKDKEAIILVIADFYKNLSQSIRDNTKVLEARREILQYTTTRVSVEKKVAIKQLSTDNKIHKIIRSLSKVKASWLNGLTTKVL